MMDSQDTTHGTAGRAQLGRLGDMPDYKVADGHPDVRGWSVKTADGQTIGKVDELIADTAEMRVRYVDVELDRTLDTLVRDAATAGDQERHTLLPIGAVRLDDEHDDVLVDGYTTAQIAAMPRYTGREISADYERALRSRWLGDAVTAGGVDYTHAHFDDQRAYASRRGASVGGRDTGMTGATDRATRTGPLDALADRVDDLKDRVDGNPASRPGPDATDRPI